MKTHRMLSLSLLTLCGAGLLTAQDAQQQQQATLEYFGAQIGNEIDTTATGCYIGTAGSVVHDGEFTYILSNSHVLAREGEGVIGENIMHTVSSFCSGDAIHVGELAADVPLLFGRRSSNRVDAALARITPNVDPLSNSTGILHIGNNLDFSDAYGVSSSIKAPALNMAVKKSGRTTGLTSAVITHVGVNVVVRYSGGRAYFDNQFAVASAGFSSSGDSGSLIVTNNAAANPVGLLFAGSSSSTIGNPISFVLEDLAAQLGPDVVLTFGATNDPGTFELSPPPGGGNGGGNDTPPGNGNGNGNGKKPKAGETGKLNGLAKALAVRDRNEARLLEQDGVLGSGIGLTNGTPNITVFVNRDNPAAARNVPASIEGIPVNIEMTDEFVAF